MATVKLYHDEWWPMVIEDDTDFASEYEIPDALLAEWREARARFWEVQDKITEIYDRTNAAKPKPMVK